jgi:hypothetical protein
MTIDRWIAVVGLLIALPGFFELFLTGHQTEGTLAVLLGFVVVGFAWIIQYILSLPSFSAKSTEVKLELDMDKTGSVARITKHHELRPNTEAQRLVIRHNGGRGGSKEFSWKGESGLIEKVEEIKVFADTVVTVLFAPPIPRWRPFTGALSYHLIDSFLEKREFFAHVVEFPAKTLTIKVVFPKERPCLEATAARRVGANEKRLDDLKRLHEGELVELTLKRPAVGSEYWIRWNW